MNKTADEITELSPYPNYYTYEQMLTIFGISSEEFDNLLNGYYDMVSGPEQTGLKEMQVTEDYKQIQYSGYLLIQRGDAQQASFRTWYD